MSVELIFNVVRRFKRNVTRTTDAQIAAMTAIAGVLPTHQSPAVTQSGVWTDTIATLFRQMFRRPSLQWLARCTAESFQDLDAKNVSIFSFWGCVDVFLLLFLRSPFPVSHRP